MNRLSLRRFGAAFWLIAACVAADAPQRGASAPDLATLASLARAGGGADHFKTTDFVAALDDARADAEFSELVKRYGAARVKQFVTVFDFAVGDAVRRLHEHGLALPAASSPAPVDGSALTAALAAAGKSGRGTALSTAAVFDRLLTPAIRTAVFSAAAAAYGSGAVTTFDTLFSDTIDDLSSAP